jgi:hypothetical protein
MLITNSNDITEFITSGFLSAQPMLSKCLSVGEIDQVANWLKQKKLLGIILFQKLCLL